MYLKLTENLKWQSSDVDWCEGNFHTSSHIVEFYNTVSNIPFVLLPLLLMFLSRDYARRIGWDMHFVCGLLITVGLSSAYFHATLSMLGQLLDELAILWVDMASVAMWLPLECFPTFCSHSRKAARKTMWIACVVCTVLGFLVPAANMFALLIFSLVICRTLYLYIKKSGSELEYGICVRSMTMWLLGMTVWAIDMFACNSYISVHFPYLHALWHVTAVVAVIPILVLFSLIEARTTYPHEKAELRFWPSWSRELGIPYVTFPKNNIIISNNNKANLKSS